MHNILVEYWVPGSYEIVACVECVEELQELFSHARCRGLVSKLNAEPLPDDRVDHKVKNPGR